MGNQSSSVPGSRSSFRRHSVRSSRSLVQKTGSVRHHAIATNNPKWNEAAPDSVVEVNARFARSGSVLYVEGHSDMGSYSTNACRDLVDGGWGLPSFTEGNGDGNEQVSQVVDDDVVETPVDPNQAEPEWLANIGNTTDEERCCEHDDCTYSAGHRQSDAAAVEGREASGSIVEFEVEADPEEDMQDEEWLQNVVDSTHGYGLHADALEQTLPHARESRDYASESVFEFNPTFDFDGSNLQDAEWLDRVGADEGLCCAANGDCSYSPGNHGYKHESDLVVEQLDLESQCNGSSAYGSKRMSQDQAAAAAAFGARCVRESRHYASESVVEDYSVQAQLHIPAWVDNAGDKCGMCCGADTECSYSFKSE